MTRKSAVFVDGENLVMRYQAMQTIGRIPKPDVAFRKDEFVWHNHVFRKAPFDLQRISYYTSAVGDSDYIEELTDYIQTHSTTTKDPDTGRTTEMRLNAKVFKRPSRSQKSRLVDIHITLDMLRAAYSHEIDQLFLISGDADFLPVIQEVMRRGKIVHVFALSNSASRVMMQEPDHSE